MMNIKKQIDRNSVILSILIWGAVWGIFEATVGYMLHMLPIKIGWLVWYPVACFFMAGAYRTSRSVASVFWVGLLCASIKLVNLLLPIRVDKVLNPSISIVFEAMSIAGVIYLVNRFLGGEPRSAWQVGAYALAMNTGWRLLYALYLLFLVPGWMYEISVISSAEQIFTFFVVHNLLTSLVLFAGFLSRKFIITLLDILHRDIVKLFTLVPQRLAPALKACTVATLLGTSIILELLL